jgi:hypothetical protein
VAALAADLAAQSALWRTQSARHNEEMAALQAQAAARELAHSTAIASLEAKLAECMASAGEPAVLAAP